MVCWFSYTAGSSIFTSIMLIYLWDDNTTDTIIWLILLTEFWRKAERYSWLAAVFVVLLEVLVILAFYRQNILWYC